MTHFLFFIADAKLGTRYTQTVNNTLKIQYEVRDKVDEVFGLQLHEGLTTFNESVVGSSPQVELMVAAYDETKFLLGGIKGHTQHGWLYVGWLWVSENCRHSGVGSRLMILAEQEAKKRGCHSSYLNTFSFQALEFYKKHGYEVYGELTDFPKGHSRIFLKKKL